MPRVRFSKGGVLATSIIISVCLFLIFTDSNPVTNREPHHRALRVRLVVKPQPATPSLEINGGGNHGAQAPIIAESLVYGADGLVRGLPDIHSALEQAGGALQDQHHPIMQLMERGRRRWDALLKRQSKTLSQAVAEYQKRYGRNPPRGFDKWFEFCRKHRVKIIDDYDQIDRDIGPWFGVSPAEFKRRVDLLETLSHSYKIILRPGKPSEITGPKAHARRPQSTFHQLEPLVPYLTEELTLYASDHDMGNSVISDQLRNAALDAAAKKTYLSEDDLRRLEEQADHGLGLLASCDESSPARLMNTSRPLEAANAYLAQSDTSSTFVFDPKRGMSYCDNPGLIKYHGAFSWPHRRSAQMRPVFQLSKLAQNNEFLLTPLEAYWNASSIDGQQAYSPWEEKTIDKLFWRGSTTGDLYTQPRANRPDYDWRSSHRPRMHLLAQDQEGNSTVWVKRGSGWRTERWGNEQLNNRYLDVGFTGRVRQCDADDGTCAQMQEELIFRPRVEPEDAKKYKYVLDMDGNGWSSRFHRLLSSGSVVIKSTIYPEWNTDWLTPWVHYIPSKTDFTDIYDIMSFFAGNPDNKAEGHDALARQIAHNARTFALEHWRWEDMQAYMLRMLLEYARLGAEDRDAHSFGN